MKQLTKWIGKHQIINNGQDLTKQKKLNDHFQLGIKILILSLSVLPLDGFSLNYLKDIQLHQKNKQSHLFFFFSKKPPTKPTLVSFNNGKKWKFKFDKPVKSFLTQLQLLKLARHQAINAVKQRDSKQSYLQLTMLLNTAFKVKRLKQFDKKLVYSLNRNQNAFISSNNQPNNLGKASSSIANIQSQTKPAQLNDITFEANKDNNGVLQVKLPDKAGVISDQKNGQNIRITIQNAQLTDKWVAQMNVTSFNTPVTKIIGQNDLNEAEITLKTDKPVRYTKSTDSDELIIKVQKDDVKTSVFDNQKKMSLNLQNVDVRSALKIIADFADINMVVNDNVSGSLTLRLKEIAWQKALNVILTSENLGKKQMGNVLYIATEKEILAHEKAQLEARKASKQLAPLVVKFFPLSYADAQNVYHILSSRLASSKPKGANMLTSRGSLEFDRRTNTIIVRDTKEALQEVEHVINKLDVPVEQIVIQSRIVEVNKETAEKIGTNWRFSRGTTSLGDQVDFSLSGGTNRAFISANDAGAGRFDISFTKIFEPVNLQLELLALEAEGQAKVVSSPHLVVSDNQAAFIQQGKEVPFLEASASGAASVKFKQAELELKVKPQITPNNDIIMDIVVKKDQVSNDTAAGGVPIIDTRKIKTQLSTNNGQTVVLGGIHEKRQETRNKQVPLLGDMPFLGWLFKNREHKVEKKELLIFITPKITKHLNKANTS